MGGFGITYAADDATLDRKVAIKEYFPGTLALRADDGTISASPTDSEGFFEYGLNRFLDEARTLAKFHDPNIVRVLRYVEENGTAYLIMDYEEGHSLQERLWQRGPMDKGTVQQIIIPILCGLHTIHSHRYLHRDIKPDNIFLRGKGTPLLLDFGSARQALERQRRSKTVVLTPGYAPIEQYASEDEQGPYSDLYSVGATMYRCLSGENPPEATARLNALHNTGEDPFKLLVGDLANKTDPEFASVVEWLMQLRTSDRPQSAQSVIVALEQLQPTGAESGAVPTTIVTNEEAPEWAQSSRTANLSSEEAEGVTVILTGYIGPIAKILVKRAASRSVDRDEFLGALAVEIESESDRSQFLTRASKTGPRE